MKCRSTPSATRHRDITSKNLHGLRAGIHKSQELLAQLPAGLPPRLENPRGRLDSALREPGVEIITSDQAGLPLPGHLRTVQPVRKGIKGVGSTEEVPD